MPTILALQANPLNQTNLRLGKEVAEIKKRFQLASAKNFKIENAGSVEIGTIIQILQDEPEAQIVHFGGHGTESGQLVLEDANGEGRAVPIRALEGIFKELRGKIRCVVLNSCYSSKQARAIAKHIDCVIGMSSSVSDEAAITFATSFYQTIALNKSIQTAFNIGRHNVALLGLDEDRVVKLHLKRGVKPDKIFFCEARPQIIAEFDLDDDDKPQQNNNDEYLMTFSLLHVPPGAIVTTYWYIDEIDDSLEELEDRYDEIFNNGRNFQTGTASFYGDIMIRATVWYQDHGIGLFAWLSDALLAGHHRTRNKHITAAIKEIKKY